jgi:hypothetical protein
MAGYHYQEAKNGQELIDEPEWQYGISGTWALWENMTVSVDDIYGRYKKRFAFDDFDNAQTAHHFTALQLIWIISGKLVRLDKPKSNTIEA